MKSYKQLMESLIFDTLVESIDNPDILNKIRDNLKSQYGFEVSISKSALGGGEPTYFMKVFGPKSTWKNDIAMNSPLHIMIRIDAGSVDMPTVSYQVKNAKAKMRKTKYKNDADLEKKLMDYFKKNKDNFDSVLGESFVVNESVGIFSKFRDMVNKKTSSRLLMVGGKLVPISLKDASNLITLYDNQSNSAKKELEKEVSTSKGLESVIKDISESFDLLEAPEYDVAHKTFSSAVQHAWDVAEKRGYEVDEDDWDDKISLGPRKPSKGKTNSYSINLMKKGKPVKQKLHIQVYYDEGRYELNMYIQ